MDTPDGPSDLTQGELNFASNLREMRIRDGLSQDALATKMQELGFDGINQMTISRIEKGQRPVRLSEARALAYLLNAGTEQMSSPSEEARAISELFDSLRRIDELEKTIENMKIEILDNVSFSQHALMLYDEHIDDLDFLLSPALRERVEQGRKRLQSYVDGGYKQLMENVDNNLMEWFGGVRESDDDSEH
ncbi:helix-turn-helix domain-containing protein [Nesterenkonia haasae]|uniref:helix-turn-helix domain-containing protein n=1 Tax=Nesterenkonia haasae TaxID=2587813 RepID=UPI001391BB45|nr:helix-turn-helix transcriptional regulator [Nesterenkonia haasae]